jgi:hypothetical protein
MEVIIVRSFDPEEMKKELHETIPKLKTSKKSFKIEASMSQDVSFKSAYGQNLQSYLIEMLKPQKPIYQRRRLPN